MLKRYESLFIIGLTKHREQQKTVIMFSDSADKEKELNHEKFT